MFENELKSYDIALFDIELEYNKQIAPITKKITKLNVNHESKSLAAHKDFLAKEKKSKEKITELSDKTVIKNQKIEKAVENKIKKLHTKENRIKKDFEGFVSDKTELADIEFAKIKDIVLELEKEEKANIAEIKQKYKTNIESYVEKLNIYNNNFENNKKYHFKEIKKYQEILNKNIEELKTFNESVIKVLDDNLALFNANKTEQDAEINQTKADTSRTLSNLNTNIKKSANIKINEITEYIFTLKEDFKQNTEPNIKVLKEEIVALKMTFEERRQLIEKDLEINILKLEAQLEELKDSKNRKATKSALMKIDLFKMRATVTIKYEERILNEKLELLQQEVKLLEESLRFELLNLDKLKIFLLNDENEMKNTGDYFKDLNLVLKSELNNFELSNNNYLLKHEQLKTDFIKNYTKIFSDLKESTINLAQTYLEKIADNNHEIDEINKFLDTAEPLKEIKVNRLRENIEISEVIERYKIKYSKQDYETKLIKNDLDTDITVEELQLKERLSEANKEVVDIKNKEVYDKALESAKLKHSKAQEVYNLRLNNTKLERNLLKNKYDTEIDISELQKDLVQIDVRKHNALITKEIEYAIKNHKMEANYKIEVINKGLEEDLLKLEESVSKAKYEKDSYAANLNIEIDHTTQEIDAKKEEIDIQITEKLNLIDFALERELKEPSRNILKTETIIDERLSKLDVNNAIFIDFINDAIEDYKDNKLSLEQIREIIIKNEIVYDKSAKYINRTYSVLQEAVKFMSDIEKRSLLNNLAASSDQNYIKKIRKQITKIEAELEKQTVSIHTSQEDHTVLIKNFITEELNQIKNSNYDNVDGLVNFTDNSYNKIFNHLKDLQENVMVEIKVLYSALTKNDQELIDHANINAEKSRLKIEQERINLYEPLNRELDNFLKTKEAEKAEFNSKFDTELTELKAQINHHKNEALEKVKEINQEKELLVNEKLSQKKSIEETEEKEITKRYETIGENLKLLEENYNNTLDKLDKKDQEAKKIFDYEDRIYNIAVESATARFNDANVKARNIHMQSVKQYRNLTDKAKKDKDKNLKEYNNVLLAQTKKFEKNIFTVRPRLEESIGDAQKAIDIEIAEKEQNLRDLEENNNKLILSAETSLFTAFQEGYDRLNNNLQNYIDKYRVIETDYINENNTSNDVINTNNISFSNALFELSKNKHAKTLTELATINKTILREEV